MALAARMGMGPCFALRSRSGGSVAFQSSAYEAVAAISAGSASLRTTAACAIVTMAKGGLMYEASVGGQKFEYEAFGNE